MSRVSLVCPGSPRYLFPGTGTVLYRCVPAPPVSFVTGTGTVLYRDFYRCVPAPPGVFEPVPVLYRVCVPAPPGERL